MAGANVTNHGPITFAQSLSQKGPFSMANPERAGQTFKDGTPVQPFSTGGSLFTQAWDGATVANGIWGFSFGSGSNLATNGAGAPSGFGPVSGTKAIASYGSVPNTPAGVNLALGTPATDGRTLFMLADGDNIFQAVADNSVGNVAADFTPTSSMLGSKFGLTLDASGYWYVDLGVTGANAVVQLVGADPNYGFGNVNGRVRFIVLASARFLPNAI